MFLRCAAPPSAPRARGPQPGGAAAAALNRRSESRAAIRAGAGARGARWRRRAAQRLGIFVSAASTFLASTTKGPLKRRLLVPGKAGVLKIVNYIVVDAMIRHAAASDLLWASPGMADERRKIGMHAVIGA